MGRLPSSAVSGVYGALERSASAETRPGCRCANWSDGGTPPEIARMPTRDTPSVSRSAANASAWAAVDASLGNGVRR